MPLQSFPTPGAPRRTHQHDLSGITRTVGGHKIKAGELMYAVYEDSSPAGICGYVWLHGGYRWHKWTDEGVSQYAASPGWEAYNILIPCLPLVNPTP